MEPSAARLVASRACLRVQCMHVYAKLCDMSRYTYGCRLVATPVTRDMMWNGYILQGGNAEVTIIYAEVRLNRAISGWLKLPPLTTPSA